MVSSLQDSGTQQTSEPFCLSEKRKGRIGRKKYAQEREQVKEPRYVVPGKRAGLDKDRKVKEKGTGEGKGKLQEGWREAKETSVDKKTSILSN